MPDETFHCWHEHGTDEYARTPAIRVGDSGTQERICCYCGASAPHRFTLLRAPVPGHGPAYTVVTRAFDDLPDDRCTVRERLGVVTFQGFDGRTYDVPLV